MARGLYRVVENFDQVFFFLTGNLKGRLVRPGRRYEDNIKMDVKERKGGGCGLVLSDSGYEKKRVLVNAVMIFWVSYNSGKF